MIATRQDLIKKYIDYFKIKKHHHIPSASLIPENDPTVLFTTAGMHPLVPYLLGQKHPLGTRLCSVQKCIRTGDIDEVGDTAHHTFFEMLGNWSLGDYFKKEAIEFSFEFLTKILAIPIDKLAITCFIGDGDAPRDKESEEVWKNKGIPQERIAFLPKKNNWWPAGGKGEGPQGPDTEMFYWKANAPAPRTFNPDDENWVEIWNDVFMQFNKTKQGTYETLKQQNVDTGMGVERTLAILNGYEDNYQTSLFQPIITEIEKLSNKTYGKNKEETRAMRIIADHVRAATFIIGDQRGVKPSNVGQGYVVRRLIRRAVRYGKKLGMQGGFTSHIAKIMLPLYPDYQELHTNRGSIVKELDEEEAKFNKTLEQGLKKFQELAKLHKNIIPGNDAFLLFQSYGFPIEMTQELALEQGVTLDLEGYNKEFQKHQDLSRTASAGMFKSGLADDSQATRKLHTATHLLNEALRQVISTDIKQKGSNITPERLRFDFNCARKLTEDEIKKVEALVNAKIQAGLIMHREEVPLADAVSSGAQHEFGGKYPEMVSIYTAIDQSDPRGWFAKEFCTGPHVSNTKELGSFKILKEEAVAAGIRRIKAILS
jgi:alanyl-tRNA synthetase